jgi:hypothetical protein
MSQIGQYSGMSFNSMEDFHDPMNIHNNVVKRAHIKDAVLCAVFRDNDVLSIEERKNFDGSYYAKKAFQTHGKCRVLFFNPDTDKVWREIRWKNANVGTLYRRPSFMTVPRDEVPPELQVAMLCAG